MNTRDFRFEVKATDDETGTIEGFGSVFGNVDTSGDIVMQGAFANSLRERGGEVVMLYQHDVTQPIGKWRVSETAYGLYAKGRLLMSIEKGRETYERLKHGLITGLSIGYETVKSRVGRQGERLLDELKLYEISVVTFPANDLARVTAVKAADATEIAAAFRTVADRLRAESAADGVRDAFSRFRI